ncbi:glycosyltransferase [uncultured Umboniibacter sp.]|uniref:glycosyltransferase family 4 protein n=1 Tax=uncultured Umboniibacter sp. TaxID=1798917 RepID=UPI0026197613|nr:glycosyltransferase [uncultured Umboniibacter sp.]
MKLVVFCPLPPKPNGIADYFYEQIPYLAAATELRIVVPNDQDEVAPTPDGVSVYRLAEYLHTRDDFEGFRHLYHVGNNGDAVYLLPVLLSTPGTVVIHDLNLHHLMDLTTLAQGRHDSYSMALHHDYGVLGQRLGEGTTKRGFKGTFSTSQLLLNASVIDNADRVIVHSNYAARIVSARQREVTVIPHHLAPEIDQYDIANKLSYRDELGLPRNKAIFTSMGFIAKAKQIRAVLEAVKTLKDQGEAVLYVLAGQCKPHEYDVFADIKALGLENDVLVTGFLTETEFYQYLGASDFIVNLRYPSGGESSGTLTRALGMGLACVVINTGPFAEIPESCAIKLNYHEEFHEQLASALQRLIQMPDEALKVGQAAQDWVNESHRITDTVKSYLSVVENTTEAVNLSAVSQVSQLTCRITASLNLSNSLKDGLVEEDPWCSLLSNGQTQRLFNSETTLVVNPSKASEQLLASHLPHVHFCRWAELAETDNEQSRYHQVLMAIEAADFIQYGSAVLKFINWQLEIGASLQLVIYSVSPEAGLPLQTEIATLVSEAGLELQSSSLSSGNRQSLSFQSVDRFLLSARVISRMTASLAGESVKAQLLTSATVALLKGQFSNSPLNALEDRV